MTFQCDQCHAEADGAHDGYGDENAPKGWVKIQTEPLHVARVFGSRSGTTFKTLCPACNVAAEPVRAADLGILTKVQGVEIPEPKSNVSEWTAVDALRFLLTPGPRIGETMGQCRAVELAQGVDQEERLRGELAKWSAFADLIGFDCPHTPETFAQDLKRRITSAPPEELFKVVYLGDGVYAGIDRPRRLWIYLDDGIEKTSAICLEPEVILALEMHLDVTFPRRRKKP